MPRRWARPATWPTPCTTPSRATRPRSPRPVAKALAADVTPLRLQLGADSVEMVRAHSQRLLADLEAWAPVALDTGF
ncbi:hypothetical protein [Caulobacter segnis]